MKIKSFLLGTALLFSVCSLKAQIKCYATYEDFTQNKSELLDSVELKCHGAGRQVWAGGNDFSLEAKDKATKKRLKKNVFAVTKDDTLYVNCRSLQFEKARFGNGYTQALRIGKDSLLIVNRPIGQEAQSQAATAGFLLGAIGGAIVASNQMHHQVCYLITEGPNQKGRIGIQMVGDKQMRELLKNNKSLREKYFEEKDERERRLATHILPLLEMEGIISNYKQLLITPKSIKGL
ncbi:MAG: hypothetical protein J6Y99_03870 [Bacteroidales bacterium]|nr:hypothetical protein [Bacteroidales bacterium]